jgi:hypothetical protein
MKAKLYYILSGDIHGIHTVDTSLDNITIDNIGDVVKKSKRKFKFPGKQFTVLADGKVFHVYKQRTGQWKAYQLVEAEEHEDEDN